ncbi:MAG TPA: GAF domain-containing sensor histidine kinase [Chloroflexi bacterium]|nr:GAF domain-containing sensor histidine kinase [Chloroflexota bacterium]
MREISEFDQDLLEIYSELNRDRLMALVVQYARDRLKAGGSSIFLRDDITGRYVLRGTTGLLESEKMPERRIEYEPGEGLTGWIAQSGRPLRITNVRDVDELHRIADNLVWSKKYSEISAKPGRPYLGVPILSRDGSRVLGVLRVSGKDEKFYKWDEDLLRHVARLVSIAIENSQRYEREKRRARYFWLLLDISSELDPRRPIPEMLQMMVDRVREGFRTEACQIYLRVEDNAHLLKLRAASGLPDELTGRLTCTLGEGLTGHIARSGTTVQIRDQSEARKWQDPLLDQVVSHLPSGVYRSFIGVPLRLGSEVLGTLELINKIPSSPGHRDWFTDDDEGYLRLLSTAIGGVLEGARYLKTLHEVGITTMRMQRIASFGALAQRILHETSNPLAVARLAVNNLDRDLRDILEAYDESEDQRASATRRLGVVEDSLNDVSDKLLALLKSSQRVGFSRTPTQWNEVVREVLIWLAAERQRRQVEIRATYGDLPPILVEPNELFGVLVTIIHLTMEALDRDGGLIEIKTSVSEAGRRVRTVVCAAEAPRSTAVSAILESDVGGPENLSPLHFEWALAQEMVESQYDGTLNWQVRDQRACFILDLPLED